MATFESVTVLARPGDNTGSGITVANIDQVNGMQVVSPAKVKQDSNIIHDKDFVDIPFLSAPTAAGYYIHTIYEGFWQINSVVYSQGTNSTSGTIDVQVCPAGTAANAGTTQLTGTITTATAGNNSTDVLGVLIAAPTTFGPGNRVSCVIGGTTTGMVGVLVVSLKRVS